MNLKLLDLFHAIEWRPIIKIAPWIIAIVVVLIWVALDP